ncbi:hypothetical protein GBP26_06485 [Pediococcus acidilactici]|uniref:YopX family protein n=1 Tax=Pediococcus acidilactici TaxID=1254 RepID=UPI00132FC981|nr:YopX family protein [Pediococcus acidilactici]KAF0508393.1 hypothetical protein GBP26_06485 [Pediococcus acidilactici]
MIKFRAWIRTGIETYNYVKPMTIQQMIHSKKSTFSLKQLNGLVDFEQFTGLKDVNGKEIYEGDILENRKYRSIVKFVSGKFLADVVGTISRFDLIGETHGSKVIGNVHANHKLLEKES